MIAIKQRGDFKNTERFLNRASKVDYPSILDKYGREGVTALASATPVESGTTAASWGYEVVKSRGSYTIYWTNTHVNNGVPIAIILQYGHGTKNGGYVQGRDYINPALRTVFDNLANAAWKEVTR